MRLTTLCYIEKDDAYLMLHRIKKKDDLSKDMWIGVGGHFEEGESPDECLVREVKEETGLTLTSYRIRGIVTFLSDEAEGEYMFLYTADGFEGELADCDEGELCFVKKSDLSKLYFWTGDEIFLKLIRENHPVFDLKLEYSGKTLRRAVLDGKELELFDVLSDDFKETGIVRERSIVHEVGSWHKTSHVWIVRKTESGFDVLLQKRSSNKDSFPGCYDISSAGHIHAGDDFAESAVRELKEELGIEIECQELVQIGVHKGKTDTTFYGKPFLNHEYSNVYIYDGGNVHIKSLNLQIDEVESVMWLNYEEGTQKLFDGTIDNCVFRDEWDMIGEYLKCGYHKKTGRA
ncbi:MAG: NUDIX domain-containing protein [Lachnospiraceae bacterium]|nr:NUDIX domain-containing protein [Lachnospiraceae bacterium]